MSYTRQQASNEEVDIGGTVVADNANTVAREDWGEYIMYNEGNREWRFDTGRNLGQFLGEKSHKVIASVGTTDYTRFGVWRRESTKNARRSDDIQSNHGGPGTFAYSLLDPTQAGNQDNPSFRRGSATYVGETVAFQGTVPLTGTVTVDVIWSGTPDLTTDIAIVNNALVGTDDATNLGTMSLTISNLADATGDPLVYAGSFDGGSTPAPTEGYQIADILFSDMPILMGLKGDRAGQMIVGTQTQTVTTAANGDVTAFSYSYSPDILAATDVRYRFTDASLADWDRGTAATDGSTVQALFVGQGGDGALGVIGTWTLRDANVARRHIGGAKLEDNPSATGMYIRGGFGAELP